MMGWSTPFLDALASRARSPRFIIKRVQCGDEPGRDVTIGSHPQTGADFIGMSPGSFQGAQLQPVGTSCVLGAWSFSLHGQTARRVIGFYLTRGTIVALKVGFGNMRPQDYATVALGQVRNFRRGADPKLVEVEVIDILSALRSRLTTSASSLPLFYAVGSTTTSTSGQSLGDATYTVGSTASFERDTSGNGAIYVGAGTPYYRLWSASTGTTFTIYNPATPTVVNTNDIGCTAGATITEAAYLKGHPLQLAKKILLAGTNTLPASWGYGLPTEIVDEGDISQYTTASGGDTSTYHWELASTSAVTDGYAWMQGWLSAHGSFLTVRQGAITARCLQNPYVSESASGVIVSDVVITESDILTEGGEPQIEWEAFDSTQASEYSSVRISTSGSYLDQSNNLVTLPAATSTYYEYDASTYVFANNSTIEQEIRGRMTYYSTRVAERIVIHRGHLRLSTLTPGELVRLSFPTGLLWGRREATADETGYQQRRAVVTEVSPDWLQGYCRIALNVYPTNDEIFGG